jgi:2-iminobutanoate/2-iminopropanoate deaminase
VIQTSHRTHSGVVAPASRYSQAVEVDAATRWLYLSGQIGVDADGVTAATAAAQHDQVWRNVIGLLGLAGFGVEHLVRVNAYLVGRDQLVLYRAARDRFLGSATPASTVVLVAGLADPAWVVEIEAVAARP